MYCEGVRTDASSVLRCLALLLVSAATLSCESDDVLEVAERSAVDDLLVVDECALTASESSALKSWSELGGPAGSGARRVLPRGKRGRLRWCFFDRAALATFLPRILLDKGRRLWGITTEIVACLSGRLEPASWISLWVSLWISTRCWFF